MTQTGYSLPMETVAAIMTFTLSWAAGAGVALLARALALRAGQRGRAKTGEAGPAPSAPASEESGESGAMRFFGWFLFLSPVAPVAAFVALFEVEAALTFLSGRAAGPDGSGGNPLTGILVWPAFLFVGLAVLAAAVLLCRRLHRRLGGQHAGMYGLVLFAGLAAAGLIRLL